MSGGHDAGFYLNRARAAEAAFGTRVVTATGMRRSTDIDAVASNHALSHGSGEWLRVGSPVG